MWHFGNSKNKGTELWWRGWDWVQGHHKESTGDLDGDSLLKLFFWTSSQDGGIGRYTLPPHTTKRRTTTNLKTKYNQNWQKIKLYGSLTTKEFRKKHSSRPVGGVETGSWGGEDAQQGSSWRTRWTRWRLVVPHLHVDKPEGTTGERFRPCNPGFQHRKRKPQNPWL